MCHDQRAFALARTRENEVIQTQILEIREVGFGETGDSEAFRTEVCNLNHHFYSL